MKVKIGPYRNWIGPYQIAEKLLFWLDKDSDTVYNFGVWLINHTPLLRICTFIDEFKTRTIKVKYDPYDTWNLDTTLAHIILPGLKQLKVTSHGYAQVDNEDVPSNLASEGPSENNNYSDPTGEEKWAYVMDEMIWAFEQILDPEDFSSGECDIYWKKDDDTGLSEMLKGPNHTFSVDIEAQKAYNDRIQRGLILFGKYYRNLWD